MISSHHFKKNLLGDIASERARSSLSKSKYANASSEKKLKMQAMRSTGMSLEKLSIGFINIMLTHINKLVPKNLGSSTKKEKKESRARKKKRKKRNKGGGVEMIEENIEGNLIKMKKNKNFYASVLDSAIVNGLFMALFLWSIGLRLELEGAEMVVGYAILIVSTIWLFGGMFVLHFLLVMLWSRTKELDLIGYLKRDVIKSIADISLELYRGGYELKDANGNEYIFKTKNKFCPNKELQVFEHEYYSTLIGAESEVEKICKSLSIKKADNDNLARRIIEKVFVAYILACLIGHNVIDQFIVECSMGLLVIFVIIYAGCTLMEKFKKVEIEKNIKEISLTLYSQGFKLKAAKSGIHLFKTNNLLLPNKELQVIDLGKCCALIGEQKEIESIMSSWDTLRIKEGDFELKPI